MEGFRVLEQVVYFYHQADVFYDFFLMGGEFVPFIWWYLVLHGIFPLGLFQRGSE